MTPRREIGVVERVPASVNYALDTVDSDELLLITGSIYLVGEAREHWFPTETIMKQLELQSRPQKRRLERFGCI